MVIFSFPAESSIVIWLEPLPLWVLDFTPLTTPPCGGLFSALCTLPMMIGWSGSPSRKSTITSWPILGVETDPQPLPAHICDTRIQQELFSSRLPYRSQ